jgi:hypothetical protein
VRLHGRRYDTWFSGDPKSLPAKRHNYLYSEADLEPWAKRIRHVADHAKSTFVITSNHFQGKAVVNALKLIHPLTGKKVKTPEPLRHAYPQLGAIASFGADTVSAGATAGILKSAAPFLRSEICLSERTGSGWRQAIS